MNEVIINYGVDPKDKIKVIDNIEYIPKAIYDDVIADRRKLAMDYTKLVKEMSDLKKTMRNEKNNINENSVVRLKQEKPEPLEYRVYPDWAFTIRKEEKRDINKKIYEELTNKYKVTRIEINLRDESYDVVIKTTNGMYSTEYKVLRNRPNLTADEIALLVDWGNLCFGYDGDEHNGKVWTD